MAQGFTSHGVGATVDVGAAVDVGVGAAVDVGVGVGVTIRFSQLVPL